MNDLNYYNAEEQDLNRLIHDRVQSVSEDEYQNNFAEDIEQPNTKKKKGRNSGPKVRIYDCNLTMLFSLPLKTRLAAANKEEALSNLKRFCVDAKEKNGFRCLDAIFKGEKSKISIVDLKPGSIHFVSEAPPSILS